ncbi:sulfotransferase family protein [Luminiphilus sp.]|nr:sulfotransferase family protein [Luminiphilus sp.]
MTILDSLARIKHNPRLWAREFYLKRQEIFANYDGALPLFRVVSRMYYSQEHSYLYFRIPKAANSTIIATLATHSSEKKIRNWDEMSRLKSSGGSPIKLSTKDLENLFIFTVVRDPVARAISAYQDKIMKPTPQSSMLRRVLKKRDDITFNDFLDFLQYEDGTNLDGHFALQSDLCFLPLQMIDHVGKFEDLASSISHCTRAIFGKDISQVDWSPHKTNGLEITTMQRRRLSLIYEQDFEKFAYDV